MKESLGSAAKEIGETVFKLVMTTMIGFFFAYGATLGVFFALPLMQRLLG